MRLLAFFLIACFLIACDDEGELKIDCLPTDLENGVLAFYSFKNGSLLDASGQGHDLSNSGGAIPIFDRQGNSDCAFFFDQTQGTEQFLTTTDSEFLDNLSAFSLVVWYQPADSTRAIGSFESLISRGEEGRCPDRLGEWSLGLYDCRRAVFGHQNSVWSAMMGGGDCKNEVEYLTGQWHHAVAVKENDTYRIYFNGVLQEEDSGDANCSDGYQIQDVGDLFLGKLYQGALDDVIIYDRALSAQEVSDLYGLEPCCD